MRFGVREAIFFLVLLMVPIAAFWFVFKPQNDEIRQARKEITHKEAMLASLDEATARTADLAAANDEIRTAVEMIESRLPSTKEVEIILEQVAQIATDANLELKRVKAEKPVPAATFMEQPLEMKIQGPFERFYAFLLDLEQLDRITRMPDLVIERSDKSDGDIEATFTLSIYFEAGAAEEAD
jgi:type IV pilus assembly protein PilO